MAPVAESFSTTADGSGDIVISIVASSGATGANAFVCGNLAFQAW